MTWPIEHDAQLRRVKADSAADAIRMLLQAHTLDIMEQLMVMLEGENSQMRGRHLKAPKLRKLIEQATDLFDTLGDEWT